MEKPDTLRPLTLKRSSFLFIFLLLFSFTEKVRALDFTNLPIDIPYIEEQGKTTGIVGSQDCSLKNGRSVFFLKTLLRSDKSSAVYKWTAASLYFRYQIGTDFSSLRLSIYPASSPMYPEFTHPLVSSVPPDISRVSVINVDNDPRAYRVLFPFRREISLNQRITLENGNTASGVILTLDCPVDPGGVFIWERGTGEDSPGPGLYNYFDTTTKSILGSGNAKVAYTFFSGHPETPSYHPLLLLREAGQSSAIWDELILRIGLRKTEYLDRFDDYDESQSLSVLSQRLKTRVQNLSQQSLADWGDGEVDLVGYGLGGLVAERYLLDNMADHHIRRLITIGTPFKGTPRLDFSVFAGASRPLGMWLLQKYPQGWGNVVSSSFDSTKTATRSLIDGFPDQSPPTGVDYYSLAGNIDATYQQPFFHYLINKREDLGDLLVPLESTRPHWLLSENFQSFSQPVKFSSILSRSSLAVSQSFTPDTVDFRVLHGNLLQNTQVVDKVKELLNQ